ncbi:hypothetical protein BC332_29708 [Capsicum chinense]|nr:hypothetical protein BC332_29708 [Capsicum chinense]
MIVSCLILLSLLFLLGKQVFSEQNNQFSSVNNDLSRRHLDDIFILVVIVVVIISMGSSSLVEEERTYGISWHLLSFRKLMQHIVTRTEKNTSATVDSKTNNYIQICSILVILISGRILGGWHQGGVNWTNLPDISKWLEQMGSTYMKLFQLVSVIILINISLVSLLGFCSTAILVAVPRYIPFPNRTRSVDDVQRKAWGLCFKDSAYVIGLSYVYYWSLLQLLLQQPVNSMPVLFLFV